MGEKYECGRVLKVGYRGLSIWAGGRLTKGAELAGEPEGTIPTHQVSFLEVVRLSIPLPERVF